MRRAAMHPNWQQIMMDHEGWVETCFVVCIECGKKAEYVTMQVNTHISDEEAESYFKECGWSIKPTRCPECAAPTRRSGDEGESV
jgi:hypothetical protein